MRLAETWKTGFAGALIAGGLTAVHVGLGVAVIGLIWFVLLVLEEENDETR